MTEPQDSLEERLRDHWRGLRVVEPPPTLLAELGDGIRRQPQLSRPRRLGRGFVALAAAALMVMAAGAALLVGSLPGPSPTPTGSPRPWGPEPTHDTRYLQITGLLMTDNRDPAVLVGRHLRVNFEGGPGHKFYDPCLTDLYAATTRIANGVLEVGVFQSYPVGASLAPSCPTTDAPWRIDVDLGETFTGGAWRDLYGPYLFFTVPPPRLVALTGLPPGWELRDGGNVMATAMGAWMRSYSPDSQTSDPFSGLFFIQAFGGPIPLSLPSSGSQQVKVGDVDAMLYRDPASRVLTLVWRLGDDGLALIANEQEFSVDALIDLAKSAKAP